MNAGTLKALASEALVRGNLVTPPTDSQAEALFAYAELLSKWTKRMNLVSSSELKRIIEEHVLASFVAFRAFESVSRGTSPGGYFRYTERFGSGDGLSPLWSATADISYLSTSVVDIGSGAGLPGVVFSILSPSSQVFLVEPREKRASFLKEVRRELGLTYTVIPKRIEDINVGDLPLSTFHGIQRAVGREMEHFALLSSRYPGSTLTFMVSLSWTPPQGISGGSSVPYRYNERIAQLFTVRC